MIPYASCTGTKRNMGVLKNAGWRLIITPDTVRWCKKEGFDYALDNGAWSSYCSGKAWDALPFLRMLDKLGDGADWIVIPDIVAAGLESLEFSLEWLERLEEIPILKLLAVQDGMKPEHVAPFLGKQVGLFVGGTTEFKLDSLPQWGRLAADLGVYLHVGRVNSVRRIRYCSGFGVHSFDGTSVTRFASTLPRLDFARRQRSLDFGKLSAG